MVWYVSIRGRNNGYGQNVIAYAQYGADIPAIVQFNNYIGIQFHPEKSGTYGLQILRQAIQGGFIND